MDIDVNLTAELGIEGPGQDLSALPSDRQDAVEAFAEMDKTNTDPFLFRGKKFESPAADRRSRRTLRSAEDLSGGSRWRVESRFEGGDAWRRGAAAALPVPHGRARLRRHRCLFDSGEG